MSDTQMNEKINHLMAGSDQHAVVYTGEAMPEVSFLEQVTWMKRDRVDEHENKA